MHSELCLSKVMVRYNFLEMYSAQTDEHIGLERCELQERKIEETLTVDIFQNTHTRAQTHAHTHRATREIDRYLQERDCNICQVLGAIAGMF